MCGQQGYISWCLMHNNLVKLLNKKCLFISFMYSSKPSDIQIFLITPFFHVPDIVNCTCRQLRITTQPTPTK